MKHISEVLKKPAPKKSKAKRRKQGKKGVAKRVIVVPAVEQYAEQKRFILPKEKEKKTVGQPTVVTQEVVRLLENSFCYDATVEEACLFAGISASSYYAFLKKFPLFSQRVEDLRQAPMLVVRRKILQSAEHDAEMSLKYAERKKKIEFSTRSEVSHSGEVVNKHHVDPEQAALIAQAMGNWGKKVAKLEAEKK